jgi:hypothetical protein
MPNDFEPRRQAAAQACGLHQRQTASGTKEKNSTGGALRKKHFMRTGSIISPEGGIFKKRFLVTIQVLPDEQGPALFADAVDGKSAVTPPINHREGNK